MSIKVRFIIILICAVLFFTITPYILLYSIGYRIDLAKMRVVTTGGIYVRVFPSGGDVIVDSKIRNKTGIFSNSVFVQNLLPRQHSVLVKKDGYHNYQKNLLVKEKEVTKLENITLFKKNIVFEISSNTEQLSMLKKVPPEKFTVKNNNLYYSDAQENSQLTPQQKKEPLLKNVVSYQISSNNNMIWLDLDGFLKESDLSQKTTNQISETPIKINQKKSYQLKLAGKNVFLQETANLFLFDQKSKSFESFYSPVKKIEISPDEQKIIYFNDNEIFIYYLNNNLPANGQGENKALLQRHKEKIGECYWLNNDYIIFTSGDKIIISEIDVRDNINSITLPQIITLSDGKNIVIEKPEIFFSQSNKKLYILTPKNLLISERQIP